MTVEHLVPTAGGAAAHKLKNDYFLQAVSRSSAVKTPSAPSTPLCTTSSGRWWRWAATASPPPPPHLPPTWRTCCLTCLSSCATSPRPAWRWPTCMRSCTPWAARRASAPRSWSLRWRWSCRNTAPSMYPSTFTLITQGYKS